MDSLTDSWTVDDPTLCSFDDASLLNPNLICTDNGSFSVTLEVNDGTESASSDAAVTVNNVDPTIDSLTGPVDPVAVTSQSFSIDAAFSDDGASDIHSVSWEWSDGSPNDAQNSTSPVSAGHQYATTGVYKVTLTVTDDDDGTATDDFQYVVIYDPSAGFVTGGGWIDSPAGACQFETCTFDTIGKAHFGFVAKYKKGQSTPDGNTQFQFMAGDLKFHSTSYEWLVAAGANAKFKGVGTINGVHHWQFPGFNRISCG